MQPEHVAAFNERMRELHSTLTASMKLSMFPSDTASTNQASSSGRNADHLGGGLPMSDRHHIAAPSPATLAQMTDKLQSMLNSSGAGTDDAFDFFTPLPTGAALKKVTLLLLIVMIAGTACRYCSECFALPHPPFCNQGEVMISCRHCGTAVTEAELFAHVPQCKQVGRNACAVHDTILIFKSAVVPPLWHVVHPVTMFAVYTGQLR